MNKQAENQVEDQSIKIDKNWIISHLKEKILNINWVEVKGDIETFLTSEDRKYLENWNKEFFLQMISKLEVFLK